MPDGASIPIEERSADEVSYLKGVLDDGRVARLRVVPESTACANPAFDITPARLVSALITERGVVPASSKGLRGIGLIPPDLHL
jgi:methylthioribose-1-phosphate isomerase